MCLRKWLQFGVAMALVAALVTGAVAHPDYDIAPDETSEPAEAGDVQAETVAADSILDRVTDTETLGWQGIAVILLAIIIFLSSLLFILYSVREILEGFG